MHRGRRIRQQLQPGAHPRPMSHVADVADKQLMSTFIHTQVESLMTKMY